MHRTSIRHDSSFASIRRSPSVNRRAIPFATTAAALLLDAGLAVASIPDASGVFHGCYKKSDSSLRIIDDATTTCKSNETEITWSQRGPAGQTGATGQTGPAGPSDAYAIDQRGSFGAIAISTTTPTTILTLAAVPAGSYVVSALTAISGPNTFASTTCSLAASGGSPLSSRFQSSTLGGTGFTFTVIPVNTAITLAAVTDINLTCRTSAGNVVSQPSTIVATRVGTLH